MQLACRSSILDRTTGVNSRPPVEMLAPRTTKAEARSKSTVNLDSQSERIVIGRDNSTLRPVDPALGHAMPGVELLVSTVPLTSVTLERAGSMTTRTLAKLPIGSDAVPMGLVRPSRNSNRFIRL